MPDFPGKKQVAPGTAGASQSSDGNWYISTKAAALAPTPAPQPQAAPSQAPAPAAAPTPAAAPALPSFTPITAGPTKSAGPENSALAGFQSAMGGEDFGGGGAPFMPAVGNALNPRLGTRTPPVLKGFSQAAFGY